MNYEMISYDVISDKKKLNFKDVELIAAADYSCEDVYITHQLFKDQEKKKIPESKLLQDIEFPVLQVIKLMEIDGVKIDRNKLKGI
jgi:DNA polymerase I-like protein with 3'-5' exonuclease and polymerase domains